LLDGEESARVTPIVEWVRGAYPDVRVSVDTYKPLVARDVLAGDGQFAVRPSSS
jgi:dihydropteroate synthase